MSRVLDTKTHVAVIGTGFISDYHVDGLKAAGSAVLDTLVGRAPEKTAARAADLGFEKGATDLQQVLDDEAINAVVIATPDSTHKDIAIQTLKAGKAVLLQKPMALDREECAAIIAASDDSNTPLTVSFMHRHFPEVRWLRSLLKSGDLGQVQTIRMRNATPGADWADWFFTPGQVSGGVVMQLGVHGIDLVQHLFGPISKVSAQCRTLQPDRLLADGRTVVSTLEDNVLAQYELASGALVSHEMSYTEKAGCDRFRLEVNTEKGSVWLRTERGQAVIYAPEITGQGDWVSIDLAEEPLGQDHHAHWLSRISDPDQEDDTAKAGLSSILVAETIYEAAADGCVKSVPQIDGGQAVTS